MNAMSHFDDRRKYPRYYPDAANMPAVNFTLNDNSIIVVNTINISKGGLMGYTSSIENFIGIQDQNIESIEIKFPGKESFRCAGRILRLQPSLNENKCYCAVEFCEVFTNDDIETIETTIIYNPDEPKNDIPDNDIEMAPLEIAEEEAGMIYKKQKNSIPDWKIMIRVQQIENYAYIDDAEKEIEARRQAYNSFDDITQYLTIEEKWWFFEMLDEMKRHEPNYPQNLKEAFVELYRTGIQQAQQYSNFKINNQQIGRES